MAQITYYAPAGVTSINLSDGSRAVVVDGQITVDSKFRNELEAAGCSANAETDNAVRFTKTLTGGIGIGNGAVVYVPVVANDATAASANTAAIQSALDAGGDVRILAPGVVWINDTLIYDSNTTIRVGDMTTVKMATAAAGVPLLRSRAYYRMTQSPTTVTLSWSSGVSFNVQWSGHGKIVGDAIWIDGPTLQAYFKGVFIVSAVVDSDTLTVKAHRTPLAVPTGTVNAVAATSNCNIIGGRWDYNNPGSVGVSLNRFGHQHFGVYNVWERNNRVNNCIKYSYYWLGTLLCGHENIGADKTDSDLLKIYGPSVGYRGDGLYGICVDDVVSMQTKEPPLYINYQPWFGDVLSCRVSDVVAYTTTSLAVFYANAIADGVMDSCEYRGLSGRASYGLRIASSSTERSIGSLFASDISGDYGAGLFFDGGNAKTVRVDNVGAPTGKSTIGSIIVAMTGYSAESTVISPCLHTWHNTTGGFAIDWHGSGEFLRIQNAYTLNAGSEARLIQLASDSAVNHLLIDGYEGNGDQVVENMATNFPTITVENSRIRGAAILSARASCNLNMCSNDISNAVNSVVRFNATATVNLRTDGCNRLRSGTWSAAPAGTPTLNVYGWDIAIDPITVPGASATVGQYCTSTQAGVEGGLSVRTASGWVAIGSGASSVNTAIV